MIYWWNMAYGLGATFIKLSHTLYIWCWKLHTPVTEFERTFNDIYHLLSRSDSDTICNDPAEIANPIHYKPSWLSIMCHQHYLDHHNIRHFHEKSWHISDIYARRTLIKLSYTLQMCDVTLWKFYQMGCWLEIFCIEKVP